MRLDKLLAHSGFGTRTEVRKLIRSGRVRMSGETVRDPARSVEPACAVNITVDGQAVGFSPRQIWLLHKPEGLVTALQDTRLPSVGDLLSPAQRAAGVAPVGRLDRATTGLLLLTDDGELAHRLISPRRGIWKRYAVCFDGPPLGAAEVAQFAAGLTLADGTRCLPAKLRLGAGDSTQIEIQEGKYHQVRRMFAAVGRPVTSLKRIAFGPLTLPDDLPPGAMRELTAHERTALMNAVGMADD